MRKVRSFTTYPELQEKALYDKKTGYYSSGKVDFQADFDTHAQGYAPLLANRFLSMWQSMIAAQEISKDEIFTIYEFGAGDGRAAERFLDYLLGRKNLEPKSEWADFYQVLHYVIGEISPELIKRQTDRISYYIANGKARIFETSARVVDDVIPKGNGVVFSNELIDTFPFHEVHLEEESVNKISVIEEREGILRRAKRPVTELEEREQKFLDKILLNSGKLSKSPPNKILIHPDMELYYKKIASFLVKGYVVTLDYGFDGLFNFLKLIEYPQIRTYSGKYGEKFEKYLGDESILFQNVGEVDITSDICFSDLDLAGQEQGFDSCFFANQYELGGPPMKAFKVLIQRKNINALCDKLVLTNMKASSPVRYVDMWALLESKVLGDILLNRIMTSHRDMLTLITGNLPQDSTFAQMEILEKQLEKAVFDFFEWLVNSRYATRDNACIESLDESFCEFLLKLVRLAYCKSIKKIIFPERAWERYEQNPISPIIDIFSEKFLTAEEKYQLIYKLLLGELLEKLAMIEKYTNILLAVITGQITCMLLKAHTNKQEKKAAKIFESRKILIYLTFNYYPELTANVLKSVSCSDFNLEVLSPEDKFKDSLLTRCLREALLVKQSETPNPANFEDSLFHHESQDVKTQKQTGVTYGNIKIYGHKK